MGKLPQSRSPGPQEIAIQKSQLTQDQPKKTTLAEKLEAFDPVKHGGESLPFIPAGKEILGE